MDNEFFFAVAFAERLDKVVEVTLEEQLAVSTASVSPNYTALPQSLLSVSDAESWLVDCVSRTHGPMQPDEKPYLEWNDLI